MTLSLNPFVLNTKKKNKPKSAIILCHGFGGNGKSFALLANHWREKLTSTIFLCPTGPYKCIDKKDCFQWFDPTQEEKEIISQANNSSKKLDIFIHEVSKEYLIKEEKIIIGGFSQGCMVALQTGIMRKKSVKLIIGYSGKIIDEKMLSKNINSKPMISLFHGENDKIVSSKYLERARTFLENRNFNINTKMFKNCDHKIPREGAKLGLELIESLI